MPGYVRFIFIPEGHVLPPAEERDVNALYFVEETQQLFRGGLLIADHIDIEEYLKPYKVKSVEIVGEGNYVSSANFDMITGMLTLVQSSDPFVTRGSDEPATEIELHPGDSFTVVNDTPVSDNQIINTKSTYTLPAQISDISLERKGETSVLVLSIEYTDGSGRTKDLDIFGSAAYADLEDFVTKQELEDEVKRLIAEDPTIAHVEDIPTWAIG